MNHITLVLSEFPYSHHTYAIESTRSVFSKLEKHIPKKEFSYIIHKEFDSCKIDDIRTIKSLHTEKTDKASLFIIEFTIINHEAQNALLKILEEPTSDTYFIIVCPGFKKLLPTLQSRIQFLGRLERNTTQEKKEEALLSVEDFISWNIQERLEHIKKITDKKKSTLTKKDILIFLDELEIFMHSNTTHQKQKMEALFNAREFLSNKGASHKMILDMLAINLS